MVFLVTVAEVKRIRGIPLVRKDSESFPGQMGSNSMAFPLCSAIQLSWRTLLSLSILYFSVRSLTASGSSVAPLFLRSDMRSSTR